MARISDQINRSEFIRNAVSVDRSERRRSGPAERSTGSATENGNGADAASFIRGQERSNEGQGYSGRVRRRGGRGRRGDQNSGADSPGAGSDPVSTTPADASNGGTASGADSTQSSGATSSGTSTSVSPNKRERIQYQIARSIGYSVPEEKAASAPAPVPEQSDSASTDQSSSESSSTRTDESKRSNYQQTLLSYGSGFNYNNLDGEPE